MEVKNGEEPALASKRGADLSPSAVSATIELKKQKLENPEEGELKKISENLDEEQIGTMNSSNSEQVGGEEEAVSEGKLESEREGDGDSNGKAVIDRKGKGILIEEEEEDDAEDEEDDSDDDDSSDGGNVSENGGDDSDFSDDPLTEVDLDNILPSRTRRRVVHPGAYIANDVGGADEDSDDSDA
ncbi:hypothetical protein V2J09_024248 [Rumex salicifolius]